MPPCRLVCGVSICRQHTLACNYVVSWPTTPHSVPRPAVLTVTVVLDIFKPLFVTASKFTVFFHPPQSSAEVKERVERYLYSPSAPSWQVTGWTYLYLHRSIQVSNSKRAPMTQYVSACLHLSSPVSIRLVMSPHVFRLSHGNPIRITSPPPPRFAQSES